ncbi:hypothetical protein GCM10018980_72170 [Streptomyces capoamus]|uniref:DUF721 domain-containing protein n=1 Tax=Streptomyces capoamus TaxID=68183 RepID=A0A919F3D3_9ACTN|nr:DciA family protein [Streptomyces capoamus]GGW13399.1 hypothetical protein GCM10010501_16810 [Streptomyces libani subsp. rufus]GHG74963.1 hypothetical protein GCM10018980_72170 [Streptomyces capoamus]
MRPKSAASKVAPAAGGSVLAQFDDILAAAAPELTGHVQAVGFDADTGRLDVAPDAPAYGTKLRWSAPKLVAAANEKVRGANVRTLHVLAPAPVKAGPATAAAAPAPQPAAPAVPLERRTPPEGYRRAIEAHRQAAQHALVLGRGSLSPPGSCPPFPTRPCLRRSDSAPVWEAVRACFRFDGVGLPLCR